MYIPEELASYLGVPKDLEIKDFDSFKSFFDPTFSRTESIFQDESIKKRITGSVFSKISRAKRDIAKEFGIDYKTSDVEGMTLEEIYRDSLTKLKEMYESKIEDVKAPAGEINEELEKLKKQLEKASAEKTQFKSASELAIKELEEFKQNKEVEFKTYKIESEIPKWYQEVGLNSLNKIQQEGLNTIIKNNAVFDLEDNEFVVKTKDGKRIENQEVKGKFLTPAEYIKNVAIENELLKTNPHKENNTQQVIKTTVPQATQPAQNPLGRQAVAKPFGL